jgi:hypothetical protein
MAKPKDTDGQPELTGIAVPQTEAQKVSFQPKPSRRDPAIWIRKLSVWSAWPPSKDTEMRVMELHRGLNILWAESKNTPQQPRISGHGAGKTTFCRLLRFILDEKQPGTSEFRQDFRNIHQDGWVLAEVIIESKSWLVGKTLGDRGRHHFAICGADHTQIFEEQPPNGGYEDYVKALDEAVLGKLEIRSLSGSGRRLEWRHVLAWLARDQEAHYANLLAWRDTASEPEGQDLSAVDRENLIRLVMGLVEEKEQDRLTERSKVTADHTKKLEDRGPLDFIYARARNALETALGKKLDEIPGGKVDAEANDLILLNEVDAQAKGLEQEASNAIREAKLEDEEKVAEQRVVEKAGAARFQRAITNRVRIDLQKLEGKPEAPINPTESQPSTADMSAELAAVEKAIGELRGLCNRTKDEAKLLKCPHFLEPATDPKTEKAIFKQEDRNDAAEAEKRREIQRLTALLDKQSKTLNAAEVAEYEAREFQKNVKAFVKAETQRLGAPATRAQEIRDAFAAYQKASEESTTLTTTLKSLDDRKTELDREITALADVHREVVTDFGLLFDALAKELLGDQVKGEVHLGKGIEPDLTYQGRRKSAALNLSKLLAFDLSCLALGMTSERAHHPRIVIHDSPRESDLAIGIYHSLFRAAQMLENACEGEPAFQYIVTTTEAPPDDAKRSTWLLEPTLDASVPEKRLLRVNL